MIEIEINSVTNADIKISVDYNYRMYLFLFFQPKYNPFKNKIKANASYLTETEWRNIKMMLTLPLIQEELYIQTRDYTDISNWQAELFDPEEMDTYTRFEKGYYVYSRQSFDWYLDFNFFISKIKRFL